MLVANYCFTFQFFKITSSHVSLKQENPHQETDHLFSTYAKISGKTNISYSLIRTPREYKTKGTSQQ